jgi:hypothetical protein
MKYQITLEEVCSRVVEVEADDSSLAEHLAIRGQGREIYHGATFSTVLETLLVIPEVS